MSAFTTERRGGVAVVTIDTPHDAINKVSNATRWELEDLLQRLETDELVKAIVIRSGKPDIFIAGADIDEFTALRSVVEAARLSKDGQLLMQRVADSAKPGVAAIHGACLARIWSKRWCVTARRYGPWCSTMRSIRGAGSTMRRTTSPESSRWRPATSATRTWFAAWCRAATSSCISPR